MKKLLKQFGESVTGLKSNLFLKARLRLTALYVCIVAVILLGFSFFLYKNIVANLRDISEEDFSSVQAKQRYVSSTEMNVEDTLFFSDITILILASILSYVLAGKTLKPIQEVMEKQKRFAADASHELRTPLAIMKIENELALRNGLLTKESARDVIKSNLEEIDKMTQMTDDLLSLIRSMNTGQEPTSIPLNISDIIAEVSERISKLGKEKGISITTTRADSVFMRGNKILLERVFMNIFQNSLQYTPYGGSISIDIHIINRSGVITITDNGEGIDEKHLPFLFDRFYKADSSRTSSRSGTGLGLSIVKEIVDNYRGTIAIESEKGNGTSVMVTFPLVN